MIERPEKEQSIRLTVFINNKQITGLITFGNSFIQFIFKE